MIIIKAATVPIVAVTACLVLFVGVSMAENNVKARIKLDIERRIEVIDSNIYGNFVEHLGRCIYGGIHDPESKLADSDGFRKDVMDDVRDLNVTILRWPGGNFVSGYHWEDGIGPKDQRPKRIDLAWGDIEPNLVGTDEFVNYCRKIGAEPYFCINLGTGSWDEARNWVEYCNRKSGTYYSDLRRKNGSEEPYNVIYWGLGNEIDGSWQMGHRDADDYGKYALEAAKMMKWIDPGIKLVASGSSDFGGQRGGWIEWNRIVLDYLKNHVDYISLHTYLGNRNNDYYDYQAAVTQIDERIQITEGLIHEAEQKTNRTTPIYIAFDEWNVWYRAGNKEKLEEIYNLEDALVIASCLNSFIRNAHIVKIANLAQLVNVIAPLRVDDDRLWRQTTYYPLQLFANNCTGIAIDTFVDCQTYTTGRYKEVPYLDVSAAFDGESGCCVLNVVNRHLEKTIETEIISQFGSFGDKAVVYEVNGPDIKAVNSPEKTVVQTEQRMADARSESFIYRFPPHSFTMLKIPVKM